MSLVACMSAPLMAGAVMADAVRRGQFAEVTLGDAPAGSVAIRGGVLVDPGDVDETTVRPSPPPHAASAAVSANKNGTRNIFIGGFIGRRITAITGKSHCQISG